MAARTEWPRISPALPDEKAGQEMGPRQRSTARNSRRRIRALRRWAATSWRRQTPITREQSRKCEIGEVGRSSLVCAQYFRTRRVCRRAEGRSGLAGLKSLRGSTPIGEPNDPEAIILFIDSRSAEGAQRGEGFQRGMVGNCRYEISKRLTRSYQRSEDRNSVTVVVACWCDGMGCDHSGGNRGNEALKSTVPPRMEAAPWPPAEARDLLPAPVRVTGSWQGPEDKAPLVDL